MLLVLGLMDIVFFFEDSNSQDSGEFVFDNRYIFNQNNYNFGGLFDNFVVGSVNQFDYQVKDILLFYFYRCVYSLFFGSVLLRIFKMCVIVRVVYISENLLIFIKIIRFLFDQEIGIDKYQE